MHEVDSWSLNSYLLWKNITDKKRFQISLNTPRDITKEASPCVWASDAQSWEQLGRPYAFSVEHNQRWKKKKPKRPISNCRRREVSGSFVYSQLTLKQGRKKSSLTVFICEKLSLLRIIYLVIRRRDAIKDLQPVQSGLTSLGFMWKHTCSRKAAFNPLHSQW